jgi:predicted aspartyl protease
VAYELTFSDYYKYDSQQEGIEIPAVLRAGGNPLMVLAKIDTGATYCLFERWVAEELGLHIEEGLQLPFVTANSRFEAYGHEVSIEVLGIETTSTVYFFADPNIKRNVLGRFGWLDRVRFGPVDYEQMVYLADHNK